MKVIELTSGYVTVELTFEDVRRLGIAAHAAAEAASGGAYPLIVATSGDVAKGGDDLWAASLSALHTAFEGVALAMFCRGHLVAESRFDIGLMRHDRPPATQVDFDHVPKKKAI